MQAFCFITHDGEMKLITLHDAEYGCKLQSLLTLTDTPSSGSVSDEEIDDMFFARLSGAGYVAPVKVERIIQ